MKTRSLIVPAAIVFLVAFTVNTPMTIADAHSGTWKQNAEKSKYSPGPAPKSLDVKIEADDKQVTVRPMESMPMERNFTFPIRRNSTARTTPQREFRTPILYLLRDSKTGRSNLSRRRAGKW